MEDIPKDIIELASRGDVKAFEEIYKKTSAFVYNVALRITGNADDTAEVTQDAFMKIYKNLKNFKHLSSFKTWIYRIAVNAALNCRKASKKHLKNRADYDLASQSFGAPEKVRSFVDSKDREKSLSVLLDALNPDQRACIVLREIEGLDYREIAEALKININTVRSRLKRARERLLSLKEMGWVT